MIDQVRSCGTCQACCIHLEIGDLGKPAGQACLHLTRKGCEGCDVYEARPPVCREFTCLWATGKLEPKSWRPDRCGLLVHLVRNEIGGFGINVVEFKAGAVERYQKLVEKALAIPCRLVTIQYRDGRRRLYSKDAVWINDLRVKNEAMPMPLETRVIDIAVAVDETAVMKIKVD